MAHDPLPIDRDKDVFEQHIAEALKTQVAKPEHKKLFGGMAFMINGNMSVGITNKGDFMARFDGARHAEIAKWPGAKPMTFGKGDTKGFLFVEVDAATDPKALEKWVKLSLEYVRALPVKVAKPATSSSAATKKKGGVVNKPKGTRNAKTK